uniref:pyridoxal-phosphate dependent enzyme n=1 Tax=Burkholderia anthina TaxID=179879 RepID=UPI001FC8EB58|nr:pyridoxal-phosphate dependent enzyme [Burkholderia anthina]
MAIPQGRACHSSDFEEFMDPLSITPEIVDEQVLDSTVRHLREAGIALSTLRQLAEPATMPAHRLAALASVAPDAADAANLWRVHWYNDASRRAIGDTPGYLVLPRALTGVSARIVVALGSRFPMIGAHKVLAAYACLVPRLVTGRFGPAEHRAVWPSTGNYCRGGVAISRILGCRGIAVLPAGMSRERFDWLERWVADATDIVRTPGSESNVKEIYDACAQLGRIDGNVVINQFSEFGNYLAHYHCTGRAMERIFEHVRAGAPDARLAAFVSATGSAGTIAAGDYLKARHGARIVAVEAAECPTMLANGYGEHNIQGIGDKHIPLIHNVMNTDVAVGVSDRASDGLNLLFNAMAGRAYLRERRRLDPALVDALAELGISGCANVVAAIKIARHFDLDERDTIVTVATDSAAMYGSEREQHAARHYPDGFDEIHAGELFGRHLQGIADDHVAELAYADRKRIFNLGYYTWVEQQGVPVELFDSRRQPEFWTALQQSAHAWDGLIDAFNARTGAGRN